MYFASNQLQSAWAIASTIAGVINGSDGAILGVAQAIFSWLYNPGYVYFTETLYHSYGTNFWVEFRGYKDSARTQQVGLTDTYYLEITDR